MRNKKAFRFRAWDKERKEMTTDFYLWSGGEYAVFDSEDGGKSGLHEHDITDEYDLVIMQDTWVDDRHENPIFEGDIVRSKFQNKGKMKGENCKVFFTQGMFSVRYPTGESGCLVQHAMDDEIEVIGNVFENPNLLT